MSKEAMKLALEALERYQVKRQDFERFADVIAALKEALAKQEQGEPDYWLGYGLQAHTEKPFEGATPVYTTPQQRTWVEMTKEDFVCVNQLCKTPLQAAAYTEHLLKEKNV